ncbi:MAG TPA: glycosyltransferase family A protein [Candidatus Binataceae bacterium]|nr:glycosyltransferase family A protein [Candidatus Binataceae bacterium]
MNQVLVITPARDEERLLPGLIASVVAQSVRPQHWIIIDDGSRDATGRLADGAAREQRWIEVIHLPGDSQRAAGGESAVARVLRERAAMEFDFLLRLDADLSFDAFFIAQLLDEFERDAQLGIAGPTLLEPDASGWHPVFQPAFHTRGAAKTYSRRCLRAIGPLESGLGWDTLDEARAMMAGFRTRSFAHIVARHHRPQGAAGGRWKARAAAGMAAYRAGYTPAFVLARALRQALTGAGPLGALAFVQGFFKPALRRMPRPASPELIAFIRRQQIRRLLGLASLWQ